MKETNSIFNPGALIREKQRYYRRAIKGKQQSCRQLSGFVSWFKGYPMANYAEPHYVYFFKGNKVVLFELNNFQSMPDHLRVDAHPT